MKILITGANGYLGARLCQFLNNQGHRIIAVCKKAMPYEAGWSDKIKKIIIGDLILDETINKLAKTKLDVIIHLVSLDKKDSESNIEKALDVNVKITWKLLEKFSGLSLKKFIYLSTVHVADTLRDAPDSDHTYKPKSKYALTHLMCEEICNYYNRKTKINCINIRLSNSYGEPLIKNDGCWKLILNELVSMAYKKNIIILKSDGSSLRNFIHFSDICYLIESLINNEENKLYGNVLYFQSDKIYSILDVALKVQIIFYKRYKKWIPIYINKKELFNKLLPIDSNNNKTKRTEKNITIIKKFKPINEGIDSLFKYLEFN